MECFADEVHERSFVEQFWCYSQSMFTMLQNAEKGRCLCFAVGSRWDLWGSSERIYLLGETLPAMHISGQVGERRRCLARLVPSVAEEEVKDGLG